MECGLLKCEPEERLTVRRDKNRPEVQYLPGGEGCSLRIRDEEPDGCVGGPYVHNQYDKLVRFPEDDRIELSNNRAEWSIKPFVVGGTSCPAYARWRTCQSRDRHHHQVGDEFTCWSGERLIFCSMQICAIYENHQQISVMILYLAFLVFRVDFFVCCVTISIRY